MSKVKRDKLVVLYANFPAIYMAGESRNDQLGACEDFVFAADVVLLLSMIMSSNTSSADSVI